MRELYVGLCMLVFTGICHYLSQDIQATTARIFPGIVIFSMFCFSVLQITRALLLVVRDKRRNAAAAACPPKKFPLRRILAAMGMLFLYYLAIDTLGFYVSGLLFMTACMLAFRRERPRLREVGRAFGISAGFVAVIYVIFNLLLTVQTPVGLFI